MNANAPAFVPSVGTPSPTLDAPKLPTPLRDKSTRQPNKQQRPPNKQPKPSQRNQSYARQPRGQSSRKNAVEQPQSQQLQQQQEAVDKKGRVSLNHLLNFSFPERRSAPAYQPRRSNHKASTPYNKERFVNANFRFLVNATGDYTIPLADPDTHFDWTSIEQVLISAEEEPSCPICLSPPTAARVTKCGHTYCLPCILHYLELRDPKKQWRKCPICWDPVYERDFKPVQILHTSAVSHAKSSTRIGEGDKVDLSLIMRPNGSTLALPISASWPVPDKLIDAYLKPEAPVMPWHFTPDAMQFARFMLAGPTYLAGEYERDQIGLMEALKEAREWNLVEEIPFIERAMEQVNAKIAQLKRQNTKHVELTMRTAELLFDTATSQSKPVTRPIHEDPVLPVQEEEVPMSYQQYHMHRAGEDTETEPTKHTDQPTQEPSKVKTKSLDYYFYQAADGQHVYLHPLDVRILKHEYGTFERFPPRLQITVEGVEETTMTEEVRKRFKYLSHLPLACDVTFLEVDLKKLVSTETAKAFNNELKLRAKKRQDRVRREEKGRKAMEARQKKEQKTRDETNRRIMESDPFFFHNPSADSEALAKAITESAQEHQQQSQREQGPKTVWGTRAVATQEEQEAASSSEWAGHIVVTTRKKNKHKKK
ncbi:hypothetical protein BJV82DRAFT_664560 [Fennellomyces sp. T-0311]|nr:hypothetical protein BJV82DRAFT_664560 [Fennellomyces sp. T-0311]